MVTREYVTVHQEQADEAIVRLVASENKGRLIEKQHTFSVEEGNHAYRWDLFYRAVNGETIDNQVQPERIVNPIRIIEAMKRAQNSGKTEKV